MFFNLSITYILVSILKKEKRRSKDAAAQLANISNGRSLDPQSPLRLYTASLAGDTEAVENDHGVPPTLYGERGMLIHCHHRVRMQIQKYDNSFKKI